MPVAEYLVRLAGSLHRRHFLRLHLPDDFTEQ